MEDENMFYNENNKSDSIWKKIARFFASFVGLFIILTLYTLLGEKKAIYVFPEIKSKMYSMLEKP